MTLNYLRPTPDEFTKHTERLAPVPRGQSVKRSLARQDVTYFVVNQIGFRPYYWQSVFWDELLKKNNVAACTARQVGKTAAIALFALWACTYNTLPLPMGGKTKILLVSKSEAQSRKIISDIKEFMRIGDEHVEKITKGKVENFFTNMIDRRPNATNTKAAITFTNRCEIFSLPPTESARGYTASILFLDEAAFFPEEDIFTQTLRPIVSQTGNRIAMTSTPNGQQGFFFKNFDPEDEAKHHEFVRLWVPYTSLDLDSPELVADRENQRQTALLLGNERQFDQEHMASFVSSACSFFTSEDIDRAIDSERMQPTRYKGPCDLAVDFGGSQNSRTVITISCLTTGKEPEIRELYQYEYPLDDDLTLLDDIEDLIQNRFPGIQRIIFEQCPAGDQARQGAEKRNWNLQLFVPNKDKIRKYFAFRQWIRRGKVRLLNIEEQTKQFKGMVQVEEARNTKIHHGNGLRDDRVDSMVMSTYFFTEEANQVKVLSWSNVK